MSDNKVTLLFCVFNSVFKSTFGSEHYPKEIITYINSLFLSLFEIKIRSSEFHSIALTSSNEIYGWGSNYHGQLGLGHNIEQNTPQRAPNLISNIKELICGYNHSMALTESNEIYGWGSNYYRQLGFTDNILFNNPQKLSFNIPNLEQIFCGYDHLIALTESGEVYSWGVNHCGQLGLGDNFNQDIPQKLLSLKKVKQIACGAGYTMALTQSCEIYVWGLNEFQQLGFADDINRNIPEKLLFLPQGEEIKQIICGHSHSIALTSTECSNEIYVWGHNGCGQLGLGRNIDQSTPQKLTFREKKVKEIACGKSHTIALTYLNEVYVWGNNSKGQLGLGHNIRQYTPCKLKFPDSVGIKQVMCAGDYSMAITYLNEVYVWGDNHNGQLGLGDNLNRNVPTKLPNFCLTK